MNSVTDRLIFVTPGAASWVSNRAGQNLWHQPARNACFAIDAERDNDVAIAERDMIREPGSTGFGQFS
jgi:hypothetical protein